MRAQVINAVHWLQVLVFINAYLALNEANHLAVLAVCVDQR